MLVKEPTLRISASDALTHPWFTISHADQLSFDGKIFQKLQQFR